MKWNHILWGETCNWPVLPLLVTTVDGRAIVAVIPVLLHLSLNSIYFMVFSFLLFGILERFGYDIRTLYRISRRKMGGSKVRTRNEYRIGYVKKGLFTLSLLSMLSLPLITGPFDAEAATYITKNTSFMEGGKTISNGNRHSGGLNHPKLKPASINTSHFDVKMASKGEGIGLPFKIMAESVAPKGWVVKDLENVVTSWSFSGNEKWYEALIDWAEPLDQYLLVIDYERKVIELRGVQR